MERNFLILLTKTITSVRETLFCKTVTIYAQQTGYQVLGCQDSTVTIYAQQTGCQVLGCQDSVPHSTLDPSSLASGYEFPVDNDHLFGSYQGIPVECSISFRTFTSAFLVIPTQLSQKNDFPLIPSQKANIYLLNVVQADVVNLFSTYEMKTQFSFSFNK